MEKGVIWFIFLLNGYTKKVLKTIKYQGSIYRLKAQTVFEKLTRSQHISKYQYRSISLFIWKGLFPLLYSTLFGVKFLRFIVFT